MAGVGAAGGDEPLFGSRPLTRGASNLTSARSSRYVDWGGGVLKFTLVQTFIYPSFTILLTLVSLER